jgi:hypothetical protein
MGVRLVITVIVIVVLGLLFKFTYPWISVNTKVVTIKKLDHKVYDGVDKYLVFTEDDGVFENTDCLRWLKKNSSDIQGDLEEKKKFEIKYYGWRIPFFSSYPNIVEVTEVAEDTTATP